MMKGVKIEGAFADTYEVHLRPSVGREAAVKDRLRAAFRNFTTRKELIIVRVRASTSSEARKEVERSLS